MGIFHSMCCNAFGGSDITKENASGEQIDSVVCVTTSEQDGGADVERLSQQAPKSADLGFYIDDAGALAPSRGGVRFSVEGDDESWPEEDRENALEVAKMLSTAPGGVVTDEDKDALEGSQGDQKQLTARRKLSRNMTFFFVNKDGDDENSNGENLTCVVNEIVARHSRASTSIRQSCVQLPTGSSDESGDKDAATGTDAPEEELEQQKNLMLEDAARMVDQYYDILPAEKLLAEVESLIGKERFLNEVLSADLFERFARKLDFFYDVGLSCSESANATDWMEVYNGENGTQVITGLIDPSDSSVLHYNLRCEIPASITNVLAVANELSLMPTWNTLITQEPKTIGRRTAHYMVINYQMSAVGGMYKVDALNEIRRFSDSDGGFLVEYCTSVAPDHPSYQEPLKGYKRMQTVLKNVFVACGSDHTVLIQRGRLKLPFNVSKWVAKTIGGVAGKFIVAGLVNNSMQAAKPGNAWEELVSEDKYGLYHRLNEVATSEDSEKRAPQSADGKVNDFDINDFFNKRRFHRASSRHGHRRPSKLYGAEDSKTESK